MTAEEARQRLIGRLHCARCTTNDKPHLVDWILAVQAEQRGFRVVVKCHGLKRSRYFVETHAVFEDGQPYFWFVDGIRPDTVNCVTLSSGDEVSTIIDVDRRLVRFVLTRGEHEIALDAAQVTALLSIEGKEKNNDSATDQPCNPRSDCLDERTGGHREHDPDVQA